MRVAIIEVDRDYNVPIGWSVKEFNSIEEAKEWCKKETWTGYEYHIDDERTRWLNASS